MTDASDQNFVARAFLSYAHTDNEREGGRILRLAKLIGDEFEMLTGSKIEIFTDRSKIEWGHDFRDKLDSALEETTFFIPVLTPTYFQRDECRREMQTFVSSAQRLGLSSLLLSLRYAQVPDLTPESTDALKAIAARMQFVPWEEMRFVEETSAEHRRAIHGLADRLVRLTAELENASPGAANSAGSIATATPPSATVPAGNGEVHEAAEAASSERSEAHTEGSQGTNTSISDDDDDEPGTLDLIADVMPAFLEWNQTITDVSGATTAFNRKFSATGDNLPAVNASSDALARRITMFRALAADIEPELAEIERLSKAYAAGVQRLDPGLRALAEYAEAGDPAAEEAGSGLAGLAEKSREAMVSLTTAADAAKDNAKHSRDLRPVLRRFETAARNIVEASRTIQEWETLFPAAKR